MTTILSNERWFRIHVWGRNIIAIGFFVCLFFIFISASPPPWMATVRTVFFSLFLLLLIYDFLQKPGFLEVKRQNDGVLTIAIYLPDTRTFFYFNKKRIRRFEVQPEDRLELLGQLKAMPWQQKLQIVVTKPSGERFQSEVLDVSWARKAQLKRFYEVAQAFS